MSKRTSLAITVLFPIAAYLWLLLQMAWCWLLLNCMRLISMPFLPINTQMLILWMFCTSKRLHYFREWSKSPVYYNGITYIHYEVWSKITYPFFKRQRCNYWGLGMDNSFHPTLYCAWDYSMQGLTHWSRVTHICVTYLTIIASDNGLSPSRRQAIIWINAGILLIRPL